MAYSSTAQHERNAVNRMVSVVDLLENPDLARIYAYLTRSMDERTTEEVIENLNFAQTTAYENLDHLVESGLVDRTDETRPYRYQANPVDLRVAIDNNEETTYTVTPMLIAAIGQSTDNENIALYIDHNGIGGLAEALTYTIEHTKGNVTTQIMARELDQSVLEAGTILAELRDIVLTWENDGSDEEDDLSEYRQ